MCFMKAKIHKAEKVEIITQKKTQLFVNRQLSRNIKKW